MDWTELRLGETSLYMLLERMYCKLAIVSSGFFWEALLCVSYLQFIGPVSASHCIPEHRYVKKIDLVSIAFSNRPVRLHKAIII